MQPREITLDDAVRRYARDLYMAAVVPEIKAATENKKRIDVRFYERLHFNCMEAACRLFECESNGSAVIPEGELNVLWDKITSPLRGKK